MEDKKYEVLNIYRNYGPTLSFTMVLFDDKITITRVNPTLNQKISHGLVFLPCEIIVKLQTAEGIIFDVLPDSLENSSGKETESLIYSEAGDSRFIPFLCDILPYSDVPVEIVKSIPLYAAGQFIGRYQINGIEISNLKLPLPSRFIAKIYQKTRINMHPTTYNPFFFIIASSNNIFIKIVFWQENIKKYSSLRPGDIIYVTDYKRKNKLPFIDKIEYNTFTESVYFDCVEITAKDLFKVNLKTTPKIINIFETIEGYIEYMSVLLRYTCHSSLMEYVLCKVGGKPMILFFNSDNNFINIKTGMRIKITEVRRFDRCDCTYYISTIYTQFEIYDEFNTFREADKTETDFEKIEQILNTKYEIKSSMNGMANDENNWGCSHNLISDAEHEKSSVLVDEEENTFGAKKPRLNDDAKTAAIIDTSDNSRSGQNKTGEKDKTLWAEDNRTQKDDSITCGSDFLASQSTDDKYDTTKKVVYRNVFGAIGFISDYFANINQLIDYKDTEIINGKEVSINLFMRPNAIALEELGKINLVLNEIKKSFVHSMILSIVEDNVYIDYMDHDIIKSQKATRITLEKQFECYLFDNFFVDLNGECNIKDFINKKAYIVIESFRADIDTILHYVTGVIRDKYNEE